jgi:hypothetical protein
MVEEDIKLSFLLVILGLEGIGLMVTVIFDLGPSQPSGAVD